MKKIYIATLTLLVAAPTFAFAGEGNGPDFPGLQIPNVGVTASVVPGAPSGTSVTMSHSGRAYLQPTTTAEAAPVAMTKQASSQDNAVYPERLAGAPRTSGY
jgi:hypothetical protein